MRDLLSMAAAATERCRVLPKTTAQDVKCVRGHCRGAGSSRHPAINNNNNNNNNTSIYYLNGLVTLEGKNVAIFTSVSGSQKLAN